MSDRVLAAQQYIAFCQWRFGSSWDVCHCSDCTPLFCPDSSKGSGICGVDCRRIRIFTLKIIPLAVQYEIVDGYTGMGIALPAISLSTVRKTLYLLGVVLIPMFFSVEAVFYTEPISEFSGTAVSINVYLMIYYEENFKAQGKWGSCRRLLWSGWT